MILLLFPTIIFVILFAGCKIYKRNEYNDSAWGIDQAKAMQAFSALMIILHHMVQAITKYGRVDKGPISIWNFFGILFTSVFFYFSGYGLYKSYLGKENYLEGFFRKRLPKLLIPFLLTNILYVIILSEGRIMTLRHVFTSLLGITLINTNAWFVVELVILYIAFYFFFFKIKDEKKAIRNLSIFSIGLVFLSLLLGHDNTSINGHWFMGEWWYNTTLIFVMGVLVAKNEKVILEYVKAHYRVVLFLTSIAFLLLTALDIYAVENISYYNEYKYHPGYPTKLITLLIQVLYCVSFIALMLLLNLRVEYKNRVISIIGGFCFELYLIQDIFVQYLHYSVKKMPDWEYFILVYLFSLACAFLLSLADTKLLDLFNDNADDFLCVRYKKIDDSLSYETKAKRKMRRKIISAIKLSYLVFFAGMLITEGVALYNYCIIDRKKAENELQILRASNVDDYVYFGSFMLDYKKGKDEPISWIVIDKTDDHILLLSEKVLANCEYHNHHENATWKESKLCRILNHDFLSEAFTKYEQELLSGKKEDSLDWKLTDKEAFDYYINKEGGYDEEDIHVNKELVFILNEDEVNKYLPSNEDRIAYPSEAAKLEGIGNINKDYRALWWISDIGANDYSAMVIDDDGNIDREGKVINNQGVGVRPAIWIDLR